jgi:hypothetical protein
MKKIAATIATTEARANGAGLPPRALAARGNGRLAQEDSDEYRS